MFAMGQRLQRSWERFLRRYQVPEMDCFSPALSKWADSALGRETIGYQTQHCNALTQNESGETMLVVSFDNAFRPAKPERFKACFYSHPTLQEEPHAAALVSKADFLPFADDSMDLVVLHHVLEFAPNPQQILKEAARLVSPQGRILVFGFNPVSLAGLLKCLAQTLGVLGLNQRQNLGLRRLQDWMTFLDFSNLGSAYISHNLPFNNAAFLQQTRMINRNLAGSRLPFASTYTLWARKDLFGGRIIRLRWEDSVFSRVLALPKRPVSAAVGMRQSIVLPFRKNIKNTR